MEDSSSLSKAEAFEATALPRLDACFGLATGLTKSVEDAKDLVQEACSRAFRFFHRFEQGTNFKAWVPQDYTRHLSQLLPQACRYGGTFSKILRQHSSYLSPILCNSKK